MLVVGLPFIILHRLLLLFSIYQECTFEIATIKRFNVCWVLSFCDVYHLNVNFILTVVLNFSDKQLVGIGASDTITIAVAQWQLVCIQYKFIIFIWKFLCFTFLDSVWTSFFYKLAKVVVVFFFSSMNYFLSVAKIVEFYPTSWINCDLLFDSYIYRLYLSV